MRHVFVCTTEYSDHWVKTIAKKKAAADAMSEEERRKIREAIPEEHADGHRGAHCGQTMGGPIYEMYQTRLRERGISDVVVSPNACVAQHAYGCVVMVYPDGIWYRIQNMADAEKVLEQHVIGGQPVAELIHRRLKAPTPGGVKAPAPDVTVGTASAAGAPQTLPPVGAALAANPPQTLPPAGAALAATAPRGRDRS